MRELPPLPEGISESAGSTEKVFSPEEYRAGRGHKYVRESEADEEARTAGGSWWRRAKKKRTRKHRPKEGWNDMVE